MLLHINIINGVCCIRSSAVNERFKIVDCLPVGYVKDASVDYTSLIQEAIQAHSDIIFPAFPLFINDNGLTVSSNQTLTFLLGSQLKLAPTSKSKYNILKIENANNVVINNAVLIGDRYLHKGGAGEWGMGIGIYSSSNITLNNVVITNCWGDGVYIGNSKKGSVPNKNIVINQLKVAYCRRDGVSVINVNGLVIKDAIISNTNGTLPMSGINFEPNNPNDELLNILVKNINTQNNAGSGISIRLKNMYGGNCKNLDIGIDNWVDKGSGTGLKINNYLKNRINNEVINGEIIVTSAVWDSNISNPMEATLLDYNLKLVLNFPRIITSNGVELSHKATSILLNKPPAKNADANVLMIYKPLYIKK